MTNRSTTKSVYLCSLISGLIAMPALAQDYEVPRTEWGVPDLQAVWKHTSIIPFERPRELGEKRFYTEEEALEIERAEQERFDEDNEPLDPNRPPPEVAESLPPIGNYDLFWREDAQFIPTINGEMRTSAIVDPPNGRMPEIMPGVMDKVRERRANLPGRNDGPEGRGLPERCLVGFGPTAGPVMMPVIYNSNLQFVQSPGYVTIVAEMVHDARIIKITDRRNSAAEAAAEAHEKWMGDSIGHWEGDTLVVETKYFNDWHTLRGLPVDNLTVTETFRRETDNKLIYGFRVSDPSVFASDFYGEYPLSRLDENLYEYACHEGNYGMIGILAGARELERQSAEESGQ
ncbi:MAG: hypothetical protein OXU66_07585 [Gammaproteobacteria bacterium]|nr:hypothetical protein [Gammaproteobacteria bacterium]MDD9895866.1 hypothetical protein [Gammaproteobacteria bacterium]MDD9958787.1 hypothetical protein [Gammaproteobacteria bacterium]